MHLTKLNSQLIYFFYFSFTDPKIKAQIRKYLKQTSNTSPHSDSPPIELPDLNSSTTSISSIASTSGKLNSSTSRIPSRIPTTVKKNTTTTTTTSSSSSSSSNKSSISQSPSHCIKQQQILQSQIPTSNGTINQPPINKAPRFEAYMMTGDLILNLSRTPQNSGLINHSKKVDSLRDSPIRTNRRNGGAQLAPHAKYDSSPSSPSLSDSSESGNSLKKFKVNNNINNCVASVKDDDLIVGDMNIINSECELNDKCAGSSAKQQKNNLINETIKQQPISDIKSNSSSSSTVKSENNISSPEICFSVPTSPTSLTTPVNELNSTSLKKKESSNSLPTSPESGAQEFIRRTNQQQQQHNGNVARTCDAAGFRTSRSEDHLQATQRDGGLGAVIPIDIDEDVNSSLNTLLDTRHDSEDSQVRFSFFLNIF